MNLSICFCQRLSTSSIESHVLVYKHAFRWNPISKKSEIDWRHILVFLATKRKSVYDLICMRSVDFIDIHLAHTSWFWYICIHSYLNGKYTCELFFFCFWLLIQYKDREPSIIYPRTEHASSTKLDHQQTIVWKFCKWKRAANALTRNGRSI